VFEWYREYRELGKEENFFEAFETGQKIARLHKVQCVNIDVFATLFE